MKTNAEMFAALKSLVPLNITMDRAESHLLTEGAVWIWPPDFVPEFPNYLGLPVVRADVPEPMLGLPGAK